MAGQNAMETYHGHVRTPADAILLFEACRLGLLPRVQRRLSEKERQLIQSGSVFVWDEREAGMRRWTDGKSWSASRVSGSFLTYREMEGKRGANPFPSTVTQSRTNPAPPEQDIEVVGPDGPDGYRYKPDGLIKQSFSITTSQGQHLHLISYYARSHPQAPNLIQPTNDPNLRHIRPPKGMYPDSTAHEGGSQMVPVVTQAPMMGATSSSSGYTSSPTHIAPSQRSPAFNRSGSTYPPHASYGWPPSPMNTPPTHPSPWVHHYYAQPGSSTNSPAYYPPPVNPYYSRPQTGSNPFDRAPPPMANSNLPPPPPPPHAHYMPNGYHAGTSHPAPLPPYGQPPPHPSYSNIPNPSSRLPPTSHGSYPPPGPHPQPHYAPPPPSYPSSNTSAPGTIPSIGTLINSPPAHHLLHHQPPPPPPPSHHHHLQQHHRIHSGHYDNTPPQAQPNGTSAPPPPSSGGTGVASGQPSTAALANGATPRNGPAGAGESAHAQGHGHGGEKVQHIGQQFGEDTRALRQLDRAFAA